MKSKKKTTRKERLFKVEIELPTDTMLTLFIMAHERNMTFNSFITSVIRKMMK